MSGLPPFPVAQVKSKGIAEFERTLRQYLVELPNACEFVRDEVLGELFQVFNSSIGCDEFFYDRDEDRLDIVGVDEPTSVITGTHCGKLFEKNEPVYSCTNCSMDPTCVLCARCFEATHHEGHDVRIHLHASGYGCCDCGDPEAFKVALNCKFHNVSFQRSYTEVARALPDTIKTWLPCFIDTVLDFAIDVFRCSSDQLFAGLTQESILNDEQELAKIWGPASRGLYTLMLWNDESHTYQQVIELCQDALRCSDQEATLLTTSIDKVGRQPLMALPSITTLLDKARPFARAKLGVTIRPTFMVNLEAVAAGCLHYLTLLSAKHLERHCQGCFSAFYLETLSLALVRPCFAQGWGVDSPIIRVDLGGGGYFATDAFEDWSVTGAGFFASRASIDRSVAILFPPAQLRRPKSPGRPLVAAKTCAGVPRARLDWIFQLDPQLWKSVRLELQALFTRSLLALPHFKAAAAAHYAINYPFYSRMPAHRNPEPDTSLISYAVQLFTAPSVALLLASELDFVSYLFLVLERQMIGKVTPPESCYTSAPSPPAPCGEDIYEHRMLRSILRDLDYFLDFPAVRGHISRDPTLSLFLQALHFISGFQHFFPSRRKTGDHVAYQDPRFNVAIESAFHILGIVRPLAEAFHNQPAALMRAIKFTARKILGWIAHRDAPPMRKLATHLGTSLEILQCDVATQPMSLLAVGREVLDAAHLAAAGYSDLCHLLVDDVGGGRLAQLQRLLDFPIQTLALSAQVRANLWVRNGLGFLTEEAYFRSSPKSYLDHCLFMAQHLLSLLPPEVALATLVDRYQLNAWFFLDAEPSPFDTLQQVSLAEDMLLLILHCVCERGRLLGETPEEEACQLIAQNTFLPTTFSKLQASLPPHITQLDHLNQLLTQLCTFKPPDTLADSGKYSLKREYHHLVNTHHYSHTRNRIDHAADFKRSAAKDPLWFIPALRPLPPHSHFARLPHVLHTPYMAGILFYSLYRAATTPEARSTMIDYALQIFMVAAAEEVAVGPTLWELASTLGFKLPDSATPSTCAASLVALAEAGVDDDKEEKLLFVLDTIARKGGRETYQPVMDFLERHRASSESRAHEKERARRRALAKARRAQLLKEMNSAQTSFVEQHSELYRATDQVEGELVAPEEESASPGGGRARRPYAIPCLVQSSSLLAHQRPGRMTFTEIVSGDRVQAAPDSDLTKTGFHVSSCGHLIHLACLRRKIAADLGDSSPQNLRRLHFEPPQDWFSCPLCHALNNATLPVQGNPGIAHPLPRGPVSFASWLNRFVAARPALVARCKPFASDPLPGGSAGPPYQLARSNPRLASHIEGYRGSSISDDEQLSFSPRPTAALLLELKGSIAQSALNSDVKAAYFRLLEASTKSPHWFTRRPHRTEYGHATAGLDSLLYSLGYTITFLEISDRSKLDSAGMPHVFDRISTITQDTLVMLWNSILSIRALNAQVLDPTLLEAALLRFDQLTGQIGPSPIVEEPFQLLVECSLVGLISLGCEVRGLVHLLLLLQFVRATVGVISALPGPPPHAANLMAAIHGFIARLAGSPARVPDFWRVIGGHSVIRLHLVVFLRKVTLLFKAFQLPLLRPNPSGCELEDLLAALSLPASETIFQEASTDKGVLACLGGWCHGGLPELGASVMLEFPHPYSLAKLEERMDSMFAPCDAALEEICQGASNNPAVCLLCRGVLCASPLCCSTLQADAWDLHAAKCGDNVGVFLVPKEARIVLKFGGMRLSKPAPYLDMHGQAAKVSRSGGSVSSLPLYLNRMRYRALLTSVLDHQIPHQLNREQPCLASASSYGAPALSLTLHFDCFSRLPGMTFRVRAGLTLLSWPYPHETGPNLAPGSFQQASPVFKDVRAAPASSLSSLHAT
ncbi:E3 ubiquitin-protein ligase ubr1 [Massospora cicadina]|nr:E3 ubiquitin-protein ligase ubr1 [Massospora cicadina]